MAIVLSEYQKKIIELAVHGNGNIFIQAYAGCSKTTTIIEVMKAIKPEYSKLYCAFNNEIVNDIKSKTKGIDNLKINTVHALGLAIINQNMEIHPVINDDKYKAYINKNIEDLSLSYKDLGYKERTNFKSNLKKLINFARINLCEGYECLLKLANNYSISLIGDEIECTLCVLEWGKENTDEIDFTDMIWFPNIFPFRCPHFDFVFLDEAQDISIAQRELVLKCNDMKTRFIFVGDENQMIYGFNGSNREAFDALKKYTNVTQCNLPICYRCGKSIVEFARQIVHGIEPFDKCENGTVQCNSKISDIKSGDMVLCRYNAPLMKLYIKLISEGKECYYKGKDFENTLLDSLDSCKNEELNTDLKKEGVFTELFEDLFSLKKQIMLYDNCTDAVAITYPQFKNKYDNIQALEILSKGLKTKKELRDRIKNLFNPTTRNGISLSTIHKSKGLENDNVFVLCPSIIDGIIGRSENAEEKNQEKNLKYVAYTRAKKFLGIIEDDDYSKSIEGLSVEDIKFYEYRLHKKLSDNSKVITKISKDNAKRITQNFKPIENVGKQNNTVSLGKHKDGSRDTKKHSNLKNKTKKIKRERI